MRLQCIYFLLLCFVLTQSCRKNDEDESSISEFPENAILPAYQGVSLVTDKSAYQPGEEVIFMIEAPQISIPAKVRYKFLNSVISENEISSSAWKWKTPEADFKGYIVEVYSINDGIETIYATTAVDVSSRWTKFPRYGFLSKYPQLTDNEINNVIDNLKKYHINGLQFYDWHNKHHKPLLMVGEVPASVWKDIINRDIYFSTVQKYIDAAHQRNMKTMFYNLVYGTWDSGEADGVNKEWYVFTDNTHANKDFHPLSSPFLSNIYVTDPSNSAWQQYIIAETRKVYQNLNFDGYHMDQLGERKPRYKYDGTPINLGQTFKGFISAVKQDQPQKNIVMNAVSQYGQQEIAVSAADFLYTEVWSPYDSYNDLSNLIKQNNALSNNTKNTVLAAYMNYNLADHTGYFNTPSVLMTNAVIFAFGGAHLELGEHMLGKEYFPNSNLSMREDLKNALVEYYDFAVAYENLLRDGGTFNAANIVSDDQKLSIGTWPASAGNVAVFGKKVDDSQVIHLINYTHSRTQNWRDNNGEQAEPVIVKDAQLTFTSANKVKRMWFASPDICGGASVSLDFVQNGSSVSFVLPALKYWDMIVAEY